MFDDALIRRHRWSAIMNGFLIGFGVSQFLFGIPFGIFPLGVGIGMEIWQRKKQLQ
ncbi:MAG: hypothetical protein HW403_1139 [Dehalococcoidia bacterium]|nr:hypothetical protein [Dehalococcoidia bacterium]